MPFPSRLRLGLRAEPTLELGEDRRRDPRQGGPQDASRFRRATLASSGGRAVLRGQEPAGDRSGNAEDRPARNALVANAGPKATNSGSTPGRSRCKTRASGDAFAWISFRTAASAAASVAKSPIMLPVSRCQMVKRTSAAYSWISGGVTQAKSWVVAQIWPPSRPRVVAHYHPPDTLAAGCLRPHSWQPLETSGSRCIDMQTGSPRCSGRSSRRRARPIGRNGLRPRPDKLLIRRRGRAARGGPRPLPPCVQGPGLPARLTGAQDRGHRPGRVDSRRRADERGVRAGCRDPPNADRRSGHVLLEQPDHLRLGGHAPGGLGDGRTVEPAGRGPALDHRLLRGLRARPLPGR